MSNSLIDSFNEYFEMVPAISDDLKKEVFKLRYQIYCIENGYKTGFKLPPNHPEGLEFDEFDHRSIHYLIRHRKSGDYAATVRLILPDQDNLKKPFPQELNCKIDNVALIHPINRKHLGEISRFCVSKTFKKRKNDMAALEPIDSDQSTVITLDERRTFPLMTVALIACFIKASYENDIHYLYATMEPSLIRFVSTLGINFIKIGPLSDFHGERWPAMIQITDMLACVAEKKPDIWDLLTNKGAYCKPILYKKPKGNNSRAVNESTNEVHSPS